MMTLRKASLETLVEVMFSPGKALGLSTGCRQQIELDPVVTEVAQRATDAGESVAAQAA